MGKNPSYKGRDENLRAKIESGNYESVNLYDRSKQTNHYLGAVPGFGKSRGKKK